MYQITIKHLKEGGKVHTFTYNVKANNKMAALNHVRNRYPMESGYSYTTIIEDTDPVPTPSE